MNWWQSIILITIFYFVAIFQNSFLVYFKLFGVELNLIFILFFLFCFFSKNNYLKIIFLSLLAGFLLDVFSVLFIGPSILLCLVIGLFIKKIKSQLKETDNKDSIFSFLILFSVSFVAYNALYLFFADSLIINWNLLADYIYNLCIAIVLFFIFKFFLIKNKQYFWKNV